MLKYFSPSLFLIDCTNLYFDRVFSLNNKIFPMLITSVPSCNTLESLNEEWIVNRTYQAKISHTNLSDYLKKMDRKTHFHKCCIHALF